MSESRMLSNAIISNHPLVKSLLSKLRDFKTDGRSFRILLQQIAQLLSYELLQDIPVGSLKDVLHFIIV